MKRETAHTARGVDPFYLYLRLQASLGMGRSFLLEAGRDEVNTAYQMSLIGVCPVVEIQIKDGLVAVYAVQPLMDALRQLGTPVTAEANQAAWNSVVADDPLYFRPDDPMDFLESCRRLLRGACAPEMDQPFSAGFLGYVGYDAVHYLEKLPKTTVDDRRVPDIRLQWHAGVIQMAGDTLTVYRQDDALLLAGVAELAHRLDGVVAQVRESASEGVTAPQLLRELAQRAEPSSDVRYDVSEAAYCQSVERAKDYIRQGDIFQVVLSTRISIEHALHPYIAYDRLRRINPSPYMFVAEYPSMRLYGASPEVQFRAVGGRAEMKPIAGTSRGRGKSQAEDDALAEALRTDEKETAEHVMLVDLCRNDLGRIAVTGSVHVPDLMVVERYSHLFHLVSRVEARMREDVSVFHALLATFPNGTLSGAPKIRAMEIIDELETLRRGTYGGFIGMIDADANANTAIVIRTVLEVNDTQYIQVGAGIVLDSDAQREWQECHHKAGAILDVLIGLQKEQVMC